ncbi:flagellar export protein FliJ [Vibrio sp.]|uniref:flagellar export protein FliJ n=1 Tax=Vibrio sp. TaxID=678 RepID=UPI003D119913
MEEKIRAVGKLQQMEQRSCDRVGQQLDQMRQNHRYVQQQLEQLALLKSVSKPSADQALNSTSLMNMTMVDTLLQRLLAHQQQEQAVMQAQCHSVEKQLQRQHARVQGIESVMQRWQAKRDYEKNRKEQRLIEDIINYRYAKKRPR